MARPLALGQQTDRLPRFFDEGRALGYVALIQKLTDLVIVIPLACLSPCRCYLKESLVPFG